MPGKTLIDRPRILCPSLYCFIVCDNLGYRPTRLSAICDLQPVPRTQVDPGSRIPRPPVSDARRMPSQQLLTRILRALRATLNYLLPHALIPCRID
jgi:hypothetical protein